MENLLNDTGLFWFLCVSQSVTMGRFECICKFMCLDTFGVRAGSEISQHESGYKMPVITAILWGG
eukprot:6491149-Amphidinium_carterae.3